MALLPYPDHDQLPANVRTILESRPPRNVFRMLSHAPALMPGLMELTRAILYGARLDPVSRELAILRVGHLCGSHYEVSQHRKIALACGLPQAKIDGTSADPDPALYDQRELLVLRMAQEMVRNVKAPPELLAATVASFGHEQAMELMVIIGTYVLLAQVLETAEVELEEGGGPDQKDVEKIFRSQAGKA